MAFWSGEKLAERLAEIIVDGDRRRIDCAAYTLRMGPQVYVSPTEKTSGPSTQTFVLLTENQSFAIPPGQFAFLLTEEFVKVPHDALGLISIKATIKFKGLVNVSGFHVDPGFSGRLVFTVFNAGPATIHLRRGQDCFLIWYASLDRWSKSIRQKSQPDLIDPNLLLTGEVPSFDTLSQRLRAVEDQQKYYQAVAGFLVSVALLMLGVLFKSGAFNLNPTPSTSPAATTIASPVSTSSASRIQKSTIPRAQATP